MKEGGTLVPLSLFLNRTETLATQAINYAELCTPEFVSWSLL